MIKKISNELADKLVSAALADLNAGVKSSQAISAMMDAVVGIDQYQVYNLNRQGVIGRVFAKERSRSIKTTIINTSVDISDAVAEFWNEVFLNIGKAKPTGGAVTARSVEGSGISAGDRNTKCNPVNFLRSRGMMAVRNLLNLSYRRNLVQVCESCGEDSAINSKEYKTDVCKFCQSKNTEKYWPDGHASFRSKKYRKCLDCSKTWRREFKYTCNQCQSIEVRIEPRVATDFNSRQMNLIASGEDVEDEIIQAEGEKSATGLLAEIRSTFHINTHNNTISKTTEIFDLIFPVDGVSPICKLCRENAKQVCEDGCKEACSHPKIPDPKDTCGSNRFMIGTCLNYAKKISIYHKCSGALAARRVDKVRKTFIKYVTENRHKSEFCSSLYEEMIKQRILENG